MKTYQDLISVWHCLFRLFDKFLVIVLQSANLSATIGILFYKHLSSKRSSLLSISFTFSTVLTALREMFAFLFCLVGYFLILVRQQIHLTDIVYKHWPDTCEVITQAVKLWNRWIILSCYYNRGYKTCVHCIHMLHLFCNALDHAIYSGVSGQCSHTIHRIIFRPHSSWWHHWL